MIAQTVDVEKALGRPISDQLELDRVTSWASVVERMIDRRAKRLGLTINQLDPLDVAFVVGEAVARKVNNPEGKLSERIDDYSFRRGDETSQAGLYLTAREWSLLFPGSGSGAFTISTYAQLPRRLPEVWL